VVARCRAYVRRQLFGGLPQLQVLQFRMSLYPRSVGCLFEAGSQPVSQSRLLELFLTYPRRVWSREQLLDQVWGGFCGG